MLSQPSLQLYEDVEDDATELTDIVSNHPTSVVLVEESDEDAETVASGSMNEASGRPVSGSRPRQRPRPAMVAVLPDVPVVPDPGALSPSVPSADRPTPDLELLVLQQDNVRLLRENEAHQRRLEELRAALEGARRASREAADEATHWQQAAEDADAALARVAQARDHYRSFAESNLWERMRGCPPLGSDPPKADPRD